MTGGKGCISLVPLPKIDELYAKLQGYKIFSTLDLRSGYYHIGLSEDAKPKTAFVVAGMGKYQFNRVPFGLAQAPAYFQRLINEVLTGLDFAMGYLDDIVIFSRTEEEHLRHLEIIFERLRGADLKLKLQKCSFFKKHIQYLGHLLSEEGIQPLPEKLESISKMPTPKKCKTGKTIPGISRLLSEICTQICRHFQNIDKAHMQERGIQMDHCMRKMLQTSERVSPRSTHVEIHTHRCCKPTRTVHRSACDQYAYAGVLTQISRKYRSSSRLTKRSLQRITTILGGTNKTSVCHLHVGGRSLVSILIQLKITVRSDQLPLRRFLEKDTLNSKENNLGSRTRVTEKRIQVY